MTQGGATQGPRQTKLGGVGGGGKIERWHPTLENRILLEQDHLPGDPGAEIATFIAHHNTRRYRESLGNLTPVDIYTGQGAAILSERRKPRARSARKSAPWSFRKVPFRIR